MNNVQLSGRLTKNPDVRQYQRPDGSFFLVASYTLAVDRPKKGIRQNGQSGYQGQQNNQEQTADFFFCSCFNKTAEFVQKFLVKGSKVIVTGHLQSRSYVNKNGETVWRTEVIVNRHEFGESKEANDQRRAAAQYGYGQQGGYAQAPYGYGSETNRPNYRQSPGTGMPNYRSSGTAPAGYSYPMRTSTGTSSNQPAPAPFTQEQRYAPSYPGQAGSGMPMQQNAYQQAPAPTQAPSSRPDGFMNIPEGLDEELPFY